ncbi:MAG: HRDC domain-containing protein, partial [Proteobacteria bacterium]|nr:HRDC domain-containing protein [Pseudomonadota bacterium]
ARRPLSMTQLSYARADVLYLPAVYVKLAARLGERLPWAHAESSEIAAAALSASRITAENAWEDLGGMRGLDPMATAAVVALAAWRFRIATELDRPLGQVLHERTLLDLARARPDSAGAIRGLKGISPHARTRADEVFAILAAITPGETPARAMSRGAPSARAQRWSELLLAIVQLVSEQTGVASRLLATRSDADEVARLADEVGVAALADHPVFTTWRRDVLGVHWLGWLRGTVALAGDPTAPQGLRLVAVG